MIMEPTMHADAPAAHYATRTAQCRAEADRIEARERILSMARIAMFVLAVLTGLIVERAAAWWNIAALVIAIAGFLALVRAHQHARRARDWQVELAALNDEGLHRLARSWDHLPVRRPTQVVSDHAYATDLDLYGRASLSQILGPVGTAAGTVMLDSWLLAAASPETVRARQASVRELAQHHGLREELAAHARRSQHVRAADVERFLQWAESRQHVTVNSVLRVLSFALPLSTLTLIALHATGVIAGALWLIPLAAALLIYFTTAAHARGELDAAFGREAIFEHYPHMLALAAGTPFSAPLLRATTDRLVQSATPAHAQLAALHRLMHLADVRFSSLHVPLFMLTLWDVHVLHAAAQWRARGGAAARDWLAALGEIEALCSLATLHHDHPDWSFPDLTAVDERIVVAEQLGHPLIADGARVHNDVTVGPPGSFVLVTGSNMSGKSTLLRALGTNVVLAQMGAPVCARRLQLPPLEIHTSIRVQDSLARGVSYFMAELQRLKQIVDAADRLRAHDSVTLLFLLDEVLHGTNTAERRIAVRRVIRHLLETGAIGTATSHDLELAEEPGIRDTARLVHFQEHFIDDAMSFDYLLRDGIATSTNALVLMRMVGLEE